MSSQCPTVSIEVLLPEDIILDILSRLPVITFLSCKFVCKKWRKLLLDSQFVHLQIPRCLLIYQFKCIDLCLPPGTLKLLEIENEHNHNHLLREPFMSLDTAKLFPKSIISIVGSVNGLICLWLLGDKGHNTCICNPITKEYIILPKQQFEVATSCDLRCGFGVSTTGEYKVIRFWKTNPFKIEVYTLGTNEWRTLAHVPYRPLNCHDGLFYNNHLHWIVSSPHQIFSFNLDDEKYQLFPLPPLQGHLRRILGVLKGCLCIFSWSDSVASIWVMEEHGIEKSWYKELEIKTSIIPYTNWLPLSLIDGLNGRSILFFIDNVEEENHCQLVAYCPETNTIEETTIFDNLFRVISYLPTLLKLENFHRPKFTSFKVYNDDTSGGEYISESA